MLVHSWHCLDAQTWDKPAMDEELGANQTQWPSQGYNLSCSKEQFGLDGKLSSEAKLWGFLKDIV